MSSRRHWLAGFVAATVIPSAPAKTAYDAATGPSRAMSLISDLSVIL